MNTVNLKLLHTFLNVAERGSVRRTAEDTHRSPSAVSMQIRELERQVGIELFLRTSKEIVLTESGRSLYEAVRRAMTDIQNGLDILSDEAHRRRSRIVLGCAPTLAQTRLANILATFKARQPNHAVHVHEISTARGLQLLSSNEIEFYLGPSLPDMKNFDFEPIFVDPLFACVSAEYDRGWKSVFVKSLAEFPLIMLATTTAARATFDTLATNLGLTVHPQFEVQQATTALALAAAGLGVAVLPRIAAMHAHALHLRLVPIADKGAQREIGILTLPGHVHLGTSVKLVDLIRSTLHGHFARMR